MPPVRLLHPVPVFIRRINKAGTPVMDHRLREPVGQVAREATPIELRAQVFVGPTDSPTESELNVTEHSSGYLLFRTSELRAASVTLQRGDKVVKIGYGDDSRDVAYYLTSHDFLGHYPSAGGPTLLKFYFSDRHPAQGA
jgi:hypothetical protein